MVVCKKYFISTLANVIKRIKTCIDRDSLIRKTDLKYVLFILMRSLDKIYRPAAKLENYAIFDTEAPVFVGVLTFPNWSFPDIVPI